MSIVVNTSSIEVDRAPTITDSRSRTAKVYKLHESYRKRYLAEIRGQISDAAPLANDETSDFFLRKRKNVDVRDKPAPTVPVRTYKRSEINKIHSGSAWAISDEDRWTEYQQKYLPEEETPEPLSTNDVTDFNTTPHNGTDANEEEEIEMLVVERSVDLLDCTPEEQQALASPLITEADLQDGKDANAEEESEFYFSQQGEEEDKQEEEERKQEEEEEQDPLGLGKVVAYQPDDADQEGSQTEEEEEAMEVVERSMTLDEEEEEEAMEVVERSIALDEDNDDANSPTSFGDDTLKRLEAVDGINVNKDGNGLIDEEGNELAVAKGLGSGEFTGAETEVIYDGRWRLDEPPSVNGTILLVDIRQYMYAHKLQSLAEIDEKEIDLWSRYDFVWLLGIWKTGEFGRSHDIMDESRRRTYTEALPGWTNDDVIGSPFAVTTYDVSDGVGGLDALVNFRKLLHERGARLMLDFNSIFTARDAPEVTHRPELYVKHGNEIACAMDWTDTACLDMSKPETRQFQVANIQKIASLADGIYCNVSELAGIDFWREVHTNAFLVGKGLNPVTFFEPLDGPSGVQSGMREATVRATIGALKPGLKGFSLDQIRGFCGFINLHLRRVEGTFNDEVRQFYSRLIGVVRDPAVLAGNCKEIALPQFKCWQYDNRILVTANESDRIVTGTVPMNIEGEGNVEMVEVLSKTKYSKDAELIRTKGLGVILWEQQAQVFVF